MKILITGASGQLGKVLLDILKTKHTDIGYIDKAYDKAKVIPTSSTDLNICNYNNVWKYVLELNPDIIINTAAYTDVDGCETNKTLAFKVNSLGARNLAIAAEEVRAKLIHISTDYVFSGKGDSPFKEYDLTHPVGVYGRTKLMGEQYIRDFSSQYIILRTSWLYSKYRKNFVKTIIKISQQRNSLDVVNDQIGNPTNAEDLAYHIFKIALTKEYGIYHCTGNGECSWFDFADKIVKFKQVPCIVNSITTNQLTSKAKRPSYSALDNSMLRLTIGDNMRFWEEALQSFIEKYKTVLEEE